MNDQVVSTLPSVAGEAPSPDVRAVAEMRGAITRRRRAELEIAEADAQTVQISDVTAQEAHDEQIVGLDAEIADRELAYQAAGEGIADSYEAETSAAEQQYRSAAAEITRRADEQIAEVEKRYEENHWMFGSLVDSDGQGSPAEQFEALKEDLHAHRDGLAERWETLRAVYDAAVETIAQRGIAAGELPPPPRDAPVRREALLQFEQGEIRVQRTPERLAGQWFARTMTAAVLSLIFFAVTGIIVAIAHFGLSPELLGLRQVSHRMWLLITGGTGLAAGVITTLILHAIARKQTGDVLDEMQQAMSEARAGHARWLTLAKEELQRAESQSRAQQQDLTRRRAAAERQFEGERGEALAQIESERLLAFQEPTRQRDARLQEATERRDAARQQLVTAHEAAQAELRETITRRQQEFDRQKQEQAAAAAAAQNQRLQALTGQWSAALDRLGTMIEQTRRRDAAVSAAWGEVLQDDWKPAEEVPDGIRLGEFELDLSQLPDGLPEHPALAETPRSFTWPARLPFPGDPSLCLQAPLAGQDDAIALLQLAMLRLLVQLPPGSVRFTVIDPVGLGESFSAFMHLADYDELLISSRIWTEPTHIDAELARLTDHMESVFQKYLRGEYDSIEDYNLDAGEVAEPYRILVVAGFPKGFSDRAAERLASILNSGPRCGLFTLMAADPTGPMPRQFDREQLDLAGTVLRWQDDRFILDGTDGDLPLRPDPLPGPADFAAIVRKLGDLSRHIRRVEVPFLRIAPREDECWRADSRASLDGPLGRAGARRLQQFHLGTGTAQHVLVAGKTGSGKSTLLHVLITSLALRYGPNDLEFYLIDFKKGVEFKTYATNALPHARVIAIESDREFAVSVLDRLGEVLKERGERFRAAGVQDVAAFRDENPHEPMPRILLIVDEFQEFFTEDDRHAQQAALLLDRLVRQGRAFGIHHLLGSQTLGGAYSLARTTLGQMGVRIALQCSDSDAHLIFSENNTAARLLTRPGEAIYNDAGGLLEGNSPFQIAWLTEEDQRGILTSLAARAAAERLALEPPIVFEGNIPADPARNGALTQRLWSVSQLEEQQRLSAWIGDPVAISGPSELTLLPHAGANVILVGADRPAAQGILSVMLVALAATRPADELDSAAPMIQLLAADADDPGGSRWSPLANALPHHLVLAGPREAERILTELDGDLERRNVSGAGGPPRLLVIDDFARFRDLRKSDDDFSFNPFGGEKDQERGPSLSKRFSHILREGPAHDLHVILWSDTYNNIERGLGRQMLREFESRIAFQMSATDSSSLIDSPAASRLGPNRALLYRDDHGTREKFRPYHVSPEWLAWAGQTIRATPADPTPAQHIDESQPIEEAGANELDSWNIS